MRRSAATDGDRLLGAGPSLAFGEEREREANHDGESERQGEHGRPPPRLALGDGGGPRLGHGDLGGPGAVADRRQEGRDLAGQHPRMAGPDGE